MVKNRYLDFLRRIVGRRDDYRLLLTHLHGIEFYSFVPNDDNRMADGHQLRDDFMNEAGPTGSAFMPPGPCTVLEMLIGVAYRLEFELLGGEYERPAPDWFWVLIDNLGLSTYTDVVIYRPGKYDEVTYIIKRMLERGYSPNGEGGLFPLNVAQKDQRNVEIWYQMSAWVIENYPI